MPTLPSRSFHGILVVIGSPEIRPFFAAFILPDIIRQLVTTSFFREAPGYNSRSRFGFNLFTETCSFNPYVSLV